MADPVTNNIALVLPTQGGDLNTWGTVLNDGVISAIDAYLCAPLAISITSSDVAITLMSPSCESPIDRPSRVA